ncbi:hypothetical protein GWK47_055176 [Chionoecetes opilio]|uniref:Uncharacterized protein n=1 Tax=Chionoecetes opilio TaxID=41210 RepID=A0A8J4XYF8_CHIOP|nr:hypothetical protein GWK47_055176 [Chionoecetes opilio]
MCDTACFKRAPKTKKSFRQVENVLNNTSNAQNHQARVWFQADVPIPEIESPIGSGWYEDATRRLHPHVSVDDPLPNEFTDIPGPSSLHSAPTTRGEWVCVGGGRRPECCRFVALPTRLLRSLPSLTSLPGRREGAWWILGAWGFAPPAPPPLRGTGRGVRRFLACHIRAGVQRYSHGLDTPPASLSSPPGRGVVRCLRRRPVLCRSWLCYLTPIPALFAFLIRKGRGTLVILAA